MTDYQKTDIYDVFRIVDEVQQGEYKDVLKGSRIYHYSMQYRRKYIDATNSLVNQKNYLSTQSSYQFATEHQSWGKIDSAFVF